MNMPFLLHVNSAHTKELHPLYANKREHSQPLPDHPASNGAGKAGGKME